MLSRGCDRFKRFHCQISPKRNGIFNRVYLWREDGSLLWIRLVSFRLAISPLRHPCSVVVRIDAQITTVLVRHVLVFPDVHGHHVLSFVVHLNTKHAVLIFEIETARVSFYFAVIILLNKKLKLTSSNGKLSVSKCGISPGNAVSPKRRIVFSFNFLRVTSWYRNFHFLQCK